MASESIIDSKECSRKNSNRFHTKVIAGLAIGLVTLGALAGGATVDLKQESSYIRRSLNGINNAMHKRAPTVWQPTLGTKWQIALSRSPPDMTVNVPVYDIDLFDNTKATISTLQNKGTKVICYFSAGTLEDWRPDASNFDDDDVGDAMDGWEGENWINTRSASVRAIMAARMDIAVSKGCNGLDPDNMDVYENGGGGFDLTTDDAIDYVTFLSTTAHSKGLSMGLKNAGDIIPSVVSMVDYAVNEQCVQYKECAIYQPFLTAQKPVFHIEYSDSVPKLSAKNVKKVCSNKDAQGMSTVLKKLNLDNKVQYCP